MTKGRSGSEGVGKVSRGAGSQVAEIMVHQIFLLLFVSSLLSGEHGEGPAAALGHEAGEARDEVGPRDPVGADVHDTNSSHGTVLVTPPHHAVVTAPGTAGTLALEKMFR